MKKLMVVAAVAMAAFGLRAATANWNVSVGEYASDWTSPVVGSLVLNVGGVDYNAPFVDGFAETTINDVEGGSAVTATMSVVLDDGKTWTKSADFTVPTLAGEGAPADQDALSEFNGTIASAFADGNTGALPFAADAAAQGWTAAPEPTSGLLLLIGVAGLALRRRRA